MGIDLALMGSVGKRGRFRRPPEPAELLDAIEDWFHKHSPLPVLDATRRRANMALQMELTLYPIAEPVIFACGVPGYFSLGTRTTPVGTGYHIWLCDTLKALAAEFDVEWQKVNDEGDYFETGDASRVSAQMLAWLQAVAEHMLRDDGNFDSGFTGIGVSLNYAYHDWPGVVTPLGPRDADWMRTISQDPLRGVEFFAWHEPGLEFDYHYGRALARLWNDVRWVRPVSDADLAVKRETLGHLQAAYALEPERAFPWREWLELLELVGETGGEAWTTYAREMAAAASGPLIGYRRHDVTVRFSPRVSLQIGGHFFEEWGENGKWEAYDGARSLRWMPLEIPIGEALQVLESQRRADAELLPAPFGREGRAYLVWMDDENPAHEGWFLIGVAPSAVGPCMVNATSTRIEDRAWVASIWTQATGWPLG